MILEFLQLKNADTISVNYKVSVFKFMREYKGEYEENGVKLIKEKVQFKNCMKKLLTFTPEATGVDFTSQKDFIKMFLALKLYDAGDILDLDHTVDR